MSIFEFDLTTSNHDLLKDGIIAGHFFGAQQNHQRVIIEADNELEASLIAIQMGMCFGYVTACYHRI